MRYRDSPSRAIEQFARRPQKLIVGFVAAEHPRDFPRSIARPKRGHAAPGRTTALLLFDHEMTVGEGRNLRQMGHTSDLMVTRKLFQLAPDDPANCAPH